MINPQLIEQNRQKLETQRIICGDRIKDLAQSDPFNLTVITSHDDERASADDEAALNEQHERIMTQLNAQKQMVEKIDSALGRIKKGAYGVCEVCGKDIEESRLTAIPLAALCLTDEKSNESKAKKRI